MLIVVGMLPFSKAAGSRMSTVKELWHAGLVSALAIGRTEDSEMDASFARQSGKRAPRLPF